MHEETSILVADLLSPTGYEYLGEQVYKDVGGKVYDRKFSVKIRDKIISRNDLPTLVNYAYYCFHRNIKAPK